MDDGFKSGICLTLIFILNIKIYIKYKNLKKVLEFKFGLTVTIQIRNTSSGTLGYRFYISSKL